MIKRSYGSVGYRFGFGLCRADFTGSWLSVIFYQYVFTIYSMCFIQPMRPYLRSMDKGSKASHHWGKKMLRFIEMKTKISELKCSHFYNDGDDTRFVWYEINKSCFIVYITSYRSRLPAGNPAKKRTLPR